MGNRIPHHCEFQQLLSQAFLAWPDKEILNLLSEKISYIPIEIWSVRKWPPITGYVTKVFEAGEMKVESSDEQQDRTGTGTKLPMCERFAVLSVPLVNRECLTLNGVQCLHNQIIGEIRNGFLRFGTGHRREWYHKLLYPCRPLYTYY